MNKILGILLVIGLIFGIEACTKIETPSSSCKSVISLDSYARQLFFDTKNNSYWIYRDSVGNIDSSWVSGTVDGFLNPGCIENYTYNLASSVLHNDFNVTGSIWGSYTQVYFIYDFANSSGRGGDDCLQACFLNGTVYMPFDTIFPSVTVETIPNYTVNQYSFSNALKITSTAQCPVHYIVVVPGIGIIEKWNGQGYSAYKLIKYSIN